MLLARPSEPAPALVKRLGAGVIDFQLCTGLCAGGGHSLRLGCWLLFRLRGFAAEVVLPSRAPVFHPGLWQPQAQGKGLRRWGGNQILHELPCAKVLRGGPVAGFGGGRADNVIHISPPVQPAPELRYADGGGAVFAVSKTC